MDRSANSSPCLEATLSISDHAQLSNKTEELLKNLHTDPYDEDEVGIYVETYDDLYILHVLEEKEKYIAI